MNKAVFIDKDGTLIHDIPYNVDPELIRLQEGAGDGLKLLKDKGYLLIVVSNQSGVARGYFPEEALVAVKERIQQELRSEGVQLDGFYTCPHHPCGIVDKYTIRCSCRKPEPGLLLRAAADFNVDLSKSWMIGDILHDVEAGNRAGCRTILIDNGNETEWVPGKYRTPNYKVRNIGDAARIIVWGKVYCIENEC